MTPINVGDQSISEIFVGDMGVKSICVGDMEIYTRPGSFLYITLDTSQQEE